MNKPKKYYADQREEPFINIPQPKLYLYLLLFSLTILFMVFAVGYVSTRAAQGNSGVYLPPIFIANTVLLLGCSYTMHLANKSYKADNTMNYQLSLWATFALTLIFLALQILGWTLYYEVLLGNNIGIGKQYLYALSGLHFAHVLFGLPFLAIFLVTAYRRMKEPVSVLVYFSDPYKKMKLEMLSTYWHFLDGLWVFLVLFFLVNMML